MITVFLLSRINSIINLKPSNFFFNSTGKGLPADYSLSSPAHDSLFTLGQINQLTASLIIPPSRLEILECKG